MLGALCLTLLPCCAEPLAEGGDFPPSVLSPSAQQSSATLGNVRVRGCALLGDIEITPDRKSAAIYFADFKAEVAPPNISNTKTCYIYYDLQGLLPGQTYTVSSFSYNLITSLPTGTSGMMDVKYFFEGERSGPSTTLEFPSATGPNPVKSYGDDHNVKAPYAPCSAKRELVAQVTLGVSQQSNTRGFVQLDSVQTSHLPETVNVPKLELKLDWIPCPTPTSTDA
jgi:hypothetical protein